MNKFNYISASAGAGKTRWAICTKVPEILAAGKSVLMVCPTILLCEQTAAMSGSRIRAIHGNNSDIGTVSQIKYHFANNTEPTALVITEAAFLRVVDKVDVTDWVVIKDEASEPLSVRSINCPDSWRLMDRWFRLVKLQSSTGLRDLFRALEITADCPSITSPDDDITGPLHQVCEAIRNPHLEVLVDPSRLKWKSPQFCYSAFTLPELYNGFSSVYFLGANFEHSFLFHQWKHRGVEWVNATPDHLKVQPKSSRVRIHYWNEVGFWSRGRREADGMLAAYIGWINKQLPENDYVWVRNSSDQARAEFNSLMGQEIPSVCHGLNHWRHHTKFVNFASYLLSNHDEPFYQYHGTSTSDARGLRSTQMTYQQLTRTDFRNIESDRQIDIYLPTLAEALQLLVYLPEATIVDLYKSVPGDVTGVTGVLSKGWIPQELGPIPAGPTQVTYSVAQNTYSLLAASFTREELDLSGSSLVVGNGESNNISGVSFSASNGGGGYRKSRKSERAIHPLISFARYYDRPSISGLDQAEIACIKKEKTPLFVTGILRDWARFTKENLIGNSDIIAFDFDDTEFDCADISAIFAKLEYFKYTTISHDSNSKYARFRVLVPCDRAMTLAEHRAIMEFWVEAAQKYGLRTGKLSGLDEACVGAERKFYLPHLESNLEHIYRNKQVLKVDSLLARMPRQPIVQVPEILDLDISGNNLDLSRCRRLDRIDALLHSMGPHNRSLPAVRIGGILGRSGWPAAKKHEILEKLQVKGASASAFKYASRYAFEFSTAR